MVRLGQIPRAQITCPLMKRSVCACMRVHACACMLCRGELCIHSQDPGEKKMNSRPLEATELSSSLFGRRGGHGPEFPERWQGHGTGRLPLGVKAYFLSLFGF